MKLGGSQSPVQSDDGHYYICPGRRPGAPKWVAGWCGWEGSWCGRPAVQGVRGVGASDSARRRSAGHSSCVTETATRTAVLSLQVQFLEIVDMPIVV